MKIRKAKKSDLKKISELLRIEYKKFPYNEKWSRKSALEKIKNYFKEQIIFVLEIENTIKGFVIGTINLEDDGDHGYVSEIIVSEKFQRKGYGKKLLEKIEKYFKKNKAKKIGLMSHPKSKAFKIYKKLGFKKLENFVYMTKKLK